MLAHNIGLQCFKKDCTCSAVMGKNNDSCNLFLHSCFLIGSQQCYTMFIHISQFKPESQTFLLPEKNCFPLELVKQLIHCELNQAMGQVNYIFIPKCFWFEMPISTLSSKSIISKFKIISWDGHKSLSAHFLLKQYYQRLSKLDININQWNYLQQYQKYN